MEGDRYRSAEFVGYCGFPTTLRRLFRAWNSHSCDVSLRIPAVQPDSAGADFDGVAVLASYGDWLRG